MEKALQRLADANLTSKSRSPSSIQNSVVETTDDNIRKVNIAIVDTPPATPTVQSNYLAETFKGIPQALLEKVRVRKYLSKLILFGMFLIFL